MYRVTRLFIALLISVFGLTAASIPFDPADDQALVASKVAGGVTVDFFLLGNGVACLGGCADPAIMPFGAVSGAPETAFVPNDVRNGGAAGDNDAFITDEMDGPTSAGQFDYLMRFTPLVGVGVPNLMLDVLDYVDGGPQVGDSVWLEVYATTNWDQSGVMASDMFTIAGGEPNGNVVTLSVPNPGFAIQSARVRFEALDLGTGVDNIEWTPVPEPGTVALFGTGLLALAAFARRRQGRP